MNLILSVSFILVERIAGVNTVRTESGEVAEGEHFDQGRKKKIDSDVATFSPTNPFDGESAPSQLASTDLTKMGSLPSLNPFESGQNLDADDAAVSSANPFSEDSAPSVVVSTNPFKSDRSTENEAEGATLSSANSFEEAPSQPSSSGGPCIAQP